MFKFPKDYYTDVRIEDVFETKITIKNAVTEEFKTRQYRAAFIRLFDGFSCYYSSIDDIKRIQAEIDSLASFSKVSKKKEKNGLQSEAFSRFETNRGNYFSFQENSVSDIGTEKKAELLQSYCDIAQGEPEIKNWSGIYQDRRIVKSFYSSKGAELSFDVQNSGFSVRFTFIDGSNILNESFSRGNVHFDKLGGKQGELEELLGNCSDFVKKAAPVASGTYRVILSPLAAGIFAHESFGHKSEADFMLGDTKMAEEWQIGKKVGNDMLSIIDDGNLTEGGYTPFDDEGTSARKTHLIKNGILSGRLHSAETAADLNEEPTGNARAVSYMFEPIVRMTNTYILPGKTPKKELFKKAGDAIFVDSVKHGSGLSTFTIAPNRSYLLKDGEPVKPLNISVITGNVFETLSEVEDISDELTLYSPTGGGCGKNDQYPLPVSFGGPFTTIAKMNVQ
ncbi:TldD/PmbA family protein [candidate division WOR-3 bacterium]|nr:TldD/PmbA family protein [candidate division WOR-3 bacterium]